MLAADHATVTHRNTLCLWFLWN